MIFHALMEHFVGGEQIGESLQFRAGRQLAINDQVGGFDKGGLFRQFFVGIAAVPENALVAINESDFGTSCSCAIMYLLIY